MAEGHRGRMRDRFYAENIDTIPEHIVLEKILHGVISRGDTAQAARDLMKEFGTLAGVIDAPIYELRKIRGIGQAAASFIKLIPLFYRKYRESDWAGTVIFKNADDAAQYLTDRFIGYKEEVVIAMCLDAGGKLLSCKALFEGSINSVDISIRKIMDFAIASNAARVIIAHNHLHGGTSPSDADRESTRTIYNALSFAGIHLDDHIIVCDDDYESMAQGGHVPNITFLNTD